MLEEINEPIDVVAQFKANRLVPLKFLWQSQEIVVTKVNLTYSSRTGRGKNYYFAVSDGVNYFKLQFDTENLTWTLLESYVE